MPNRITQSMAALGVVASLVIVSSTASLEGQPERSQLGARVEAVAGTGHVKAFVASRVQKNWTAPRTPWGDPDIQGVFTLKDEANTPLERPDEWAGRSMDDITPQELASAVEQRQQAAVERAPFAGGGVPEEGVAIAVPVHWFDNLAARNSRPWFVIDPPEGKIPALTAEARKRPPYMTFNGPSNLTVPGQRSEVTRRGGNRDTYLDRYLGDRCIMWQLNGGVTPTPGGYGGSFQIIQGRDNVVLRYEMVHEARVISLDGRARVNANIHGYMGYSRGHWDGNTLVVETTNLHPNAPYRDGTPGTNLRIIERLTRTSPKQVEWTITFDDATTWERPWTYSMPLTEDNTQLIHEYACHEGNYGMTNLLSGARAVEKEPASSRK